MKPLVIILVFGTFSFLAMFAWNKGLKSLEMKLPTSIFKRQLAAFNRTDKFYIAATCAFLGAILAHLTLIFVYYVMG